MASRDALEARSTFDLQCPLPQIEVRQIDERTRGVRGCGKQLTYVEICDNRPDGWKCAWVINSPAWLIGPPAKGQPPQPANTWWITKPAPVPQTFGPGPGAAPSPQTPPPTAPTAPSEPPAL